MFWECPTAYELWRQLLLWLETELSIAIANYLLMPLFNLYVLTMFK